MSAAVIAQSCFCGGVLALAAGFDLLLLFLLLLSAHCFGL